MTSDLSFEVKNTLTFHWTHPSIFVAKGKSIWRKFFRRRKAFQSPFYDQQHG